MAIDTARKRRLALGVGVGFVLAPIPDGSLDVVDRAQLLGLYSWATVTLVAGPLSVTGPTLGFAGVESPTFTFGAP